MANCINKNSEDFKTLLQETGENELVLAAKISIWQDKNGVENWPSKEDLSNIVVDIKVQELFDSNFLIFAEAENAEEVITKLINNNVIEKKCS
jgi:hypothetical protein